jgi:hypothetical protein
MTVAPTLDIFLSHICSNREIAEASKTSKLAFYEWKQDKRNNTKHSDMKSARKALRGSQRRANASLRVSNQEKIMAASIKDSKLFYKLVRNFTYFPGRILNLAGV